MGSAVFFDMFGAAMGQPSTWQPAHLPVSTLIGGDENYAYARSKPAVSLWLLCRCEKLYVNFGQRLLADAALEFKG